MNKTRLEAFSDGVLAIIITIMVLELKVPHEASFEALRQLLPVFISYIMSFVYIGIYWGNHHHLLHAVKQVNSRIMWSNMGLLFFLSLVPFSTAWMGVNHFAPLPVAVYGVNMVLAGLSYSILETAIRKHYPHSTALTEALKRQKKKEYISTVIYVTSIPCAFFYPLVSAMCFVVVSILWVIPDKHIEQALKEEV